MGVVASCADAPDDRHAVEIREPEIEHDGIGPRPVPRAQRGVGVRRLLDGIAVPDEVRGNRGAGHLVVLDEQESGSTHPAASLRAAGRKMRIPRPPRSLASASIAPPIASTNPRAIARPMPMPCLAGSWLAGTR